MINHLAQDGFSALLIASITGHVKIVCLLLNAGASVNDKETKVLSQCAWLLSLSLSLSLCYLAVFFTSEIVIP